MDVFLLETFGYLEEIHQAILACRDAAPRIPIVACVTIDEDGNCLDGSSAETFGAKLDEWPADVVRPQAWLEFDVEDVDAATRELEERGYRLLVRNRTEPWSQVVTRLISPEGLLVGVTMTPWMRKPA